MGLGRSTLYGATTTTTTSARRQGVCTAAATCREGSCATTAACTAATAPLVALNPWGMAWGAVDKCTTTWTQEQCAQLKDFLREAGLRRKVAHATKVITANRHAPLKWREDVDYGRGRNPQGGGIPPFVVKRSSQNKYYKHVVRHGA